MTDDEMLYHREVAKLEDEVGQLRAKVEDQKLAYDLLVQDYQGRVADCDGLRKELILRGTEVNAYSSQMMDLQKECIALKHRLTMKNSELKACEQIRADYNDLLAERDALQCMCTNLARTIERVDSLREYFCDLLEEESANYTGQVLEISDVAERLTEALRGLKT